MAEEKPVMLVGLDESEESFYALQWTLDRFFVPYTSKYPFRLILLHAKPTASAAIGMAGPGHACEKFSKGRKLAKRRLLNG